MMYELERKNDRRMDYCVLDGGMVTGRVSTVIFHFKYKL